MKFQVGFPGSSFAVCFCEVRQFLWDIRLSADTLERFCDVLTGCFHKMERSRFTWPLRIVLINCRLAAACGSAEKREKCSLGKHTCRTYYYAIRCFTRYVFQMNIFSVLLLRNIPVCNGQKLCAAFLRAAF